MQTRTQRCRLDFEDTLIGKCAQKLFVMIHEEWLGAPDRKPWGLLEALGINMKDQPFMKFARGRTLRLSSAVYRKYELKYSDLHWKLYQGAMGSRSGVLLDELLDEVFSAPDEWIDIYVRGFRRIYNTKELIVSPSARATIIIDVKSLPASSDLIERLNSEMMRSHPVRAPARSAIYAFRESVLSQVSAVHQKRGGHDPVRPGHGFEDGGKETVSIHPLLAMLDSTAEDGAHPAREPARAAPEACSEREGVDVLLEQRDAANGDGLQLVAASPIESFDIEGLVSEQWRSAKFVARPTDETSMVLATRSKPTFLLKCDEHVDEDGVVTKKRGLNPFLLQRNPYMQALRKAKGSKLTEEEIIQGHNSFQNIWDSQDNHDAQRELYKEWQDAPQEEAKKNAKEPYRPVWCGGNSSTPISAEELYAYYRQHGWPTPDITADKDETQAYASSNTTIDFDSFKGMSYTGRNSWARNVPRSTVRDAHEFGIVEKGLHRYLESLPKEEADSGEVLVNVGGPTLTSSVDDYKYANYPVIISGTCYNPKVFDVANHEFYNGRAEFEANLENALPFVVTIGARESRISSRYVALDHDTSDDYVNKLCNNLKTMYFHRLHYDVVEDGTLERLKVLSIDYLGILWKEGMKTHLFQRERVAKPKGDDLLMSDPLDPKPKAVAPKARLAPARGRGRGAAGRGGMLGRARGHGRGLGVQPDVGLVGTSVGPGNNEPDIPTCPVMNVDVPIPPPLVDDGVDVADDEEPIVFDDAEALALFGNSDDDGDRPSRNHGGGGGGDATTDVKVEVILDELCDMCADKSVHVLSDEEPPNALPSSSSDPAPPAVVGLPPPPPPVPPPPWEILSEADALGYVMLDGRLVGRIQYFEDRTWVNCYRHPSCKLNFLTVGGPSGLDIRKWFFDVAACPPAMRGLERKALAQSHMKIARDKWSMKARRAAG